MAVISQNPMAAAAYRRNNQQIQQLGQFVEKPVIPKYEPPPPRYLKMPGSNSPVSNQPVGADDDIIVRLMHAIAGKESGSRYGVVNPDSGALGKYQIMPFNLAPWAAAAGIKTPSREQFLGDPDMQELMARVQFQQAMKRYNDIGQVAAWWYGGEGGRKAYAAGKGRNKEAGGYPSIQEYVAAILAAMGMS